MKSALLRCLYISVSVGILCSCAGQRAMHSKGSLPVAASLETHPVASTGDAADDPAVWVHPTDPARSIVIGTNKQRGLMLHAMDGSLIGEVTLPQGSRYNNVDVRYGFPVGSRVLDIVASENRSLNSIDIYGIDPSDPSTHGSPLPLSVGEIIIEAPYDVYGFGLYRSAKTGALFAFVGSKLGRVAQYRIEALEGDRVRGEFVRVLQFDSQVEGIVADDAHGWVFVGEEGRGIWKASAEPDATDAPRLVDEIRPEGPLLRPDVEGLAIYHASERGGYLIASSQGSNEYVVYTREEPHNHLGTFRIAAGVVDDVSETDGIEVTNMPLGGGFPAGAFIAQDGYNDDGLQNFKLVPWPRIAHAFDPPLMINPDFRRR